MADIVDRAWMIAAALRLHAQADDLWTRVRQYHAELLPGLGMRLPDEPVFDREYFRQKMAEARERRCGERARRTAEILAKRSGPLVLDEPVQLDLVAGLAEAIDGFVGSPMPVELLRAFIRSPGFDLDRYQQHVLAHVRTFACEFEAVPPLIDDRRHDRVFRFIAMIFLMHAGRLQMWQEADRILVKQREAYQQGQSLPRRITEAT